MAGTGLKFFFELKRRILFFFEEHTSVIIKNIKTEKSNGGFLRKLKKSPRKWPFFRKFDKNDNFDIFDCLKMADIAVDYVIDIKMNQPYKLQ